MCRQRWRRGVRSSCELQLSQRQCRKGGNSEDSLKGAHDKADRPCSMHMHHRSRTHCTSDVAVGLNHLDACAHAMCAVMQHACFRSTPDTHAIAMQRFLDNVQAERCAPVAPVSHDTCVIPVK
jgi:hypothetical protein